MDIGGLVLPSDDKTFADLFQTPNVAQGDDIRVLRIPQLTTNRLQGMSV